MDTSFQDRLQQAKNLPEIFEIVKDAVRSVFKISRPGLMLGLADLGEGPNSWIGGYHIVATNAIIMNKRPLDAIEKDHRDLYKPYAFVILLHEYIHTLGVLDETECRMRTLKVARELFKTGLVVELAQDVGKYLPYFKEMQYGWRPVMDPYIRYVRNFDASSAGYFV